jgi:hypothetical protein
MKYTIKAHPTKYNGVQYRSRLEARWAAFFDMIGWNHEYEPIDLLGWSPDFRVVFPCGHSECNGSHSLLVEIKPYFSIKQFSGHPSGDYIGCGLGEKWNPDMCCSAAQFGSNPEVSYWCMSHGAGGGDEDLTNWIPRDYSKLWSEAGNLTQWIPEERNVQSIENVLLKMKFVDRRSDFIRDMDKEFLKVIREHKKKSDKGSIE